MAPLGSTATPLGVSNFVDEPAMTRIGAALPLACGPKNELAFDALVVGAHNVDVPGWIDGDRERRRQPRPCTANDPNRRSIATRAPREQGDAAIAEIRDVRPSLGVDGDAGRLVQVRPDPSIVRIGAALRFAVGM